MNNRFFRILTLLFGLAMIAGGLFRIVSAARAEEAPGATVPLGIAVELTDGEGSPRATLTALSLASPKAGQIAVRYALTNRGDRALTLVEFYVRYLDDRGIDLRDEALQVMAQLQDVPIEPGETREFEHRHYFEGVENATAVTLEQFTLMDEDELPRWTEPRPNSLLPEFCNDPEFAAHFENLDANLPVRMVCHVDQEADRVVTDADAILAVIGSLRDMRIGEESSLDYCDAGIGFWFTMADGSEWGVSFNAPGLLSWHGRNYEVENF